MGVVKGQIKQHYEGQKHPHKQNTSQKFPVLRYARMTCLVNIHVDALAARGARLKVSLTGSCWPGPTNPLDVRVSGGQQVLAGQLADNADGSEFTAKRLFADPA